MSPESLAPHFELNGVAKLQTRDESGQLPSRVVAIGHFGNFELHARVGDHCPGYQCVTTYRSFDQPALDRLFLRLRNRSGCRYFERRSEAGALRAFLSPNGQLVGLLADQHAGDSGLRLPFFGQECSTSAAPAVFARRYHCRLHVAICYRIALARWRIEIGDEIPTHVDGQSRSSAEIMSDVNQAYEAAVRRDPANWFWVHRRWKPAPPARARQTSPAPAMAVVGEDG